MTKLRLEQTYRRHATALVTAAALLLGTSSVHAQQAFKTPEEAATALATAVKSGDTRDVVKVLGRGGVDIMFSGDEVADREARERFVGAYDARHNVTVDGDKAVLVVGTDDFPLPIPLVRQGTNWKFDTAAGRLEVLYRRIGRNELDAIQTSLAVVDAQNEYAEKDRTGAGPGVYARRIISSAGKKDGLYWPASDGDASPLGELIAQASEEGYKAGAGRTPYHGYYYRILTRQGPKAPGGLLDYVVKGKMIGGFGLLAYPADYGNSGVMTFLVNHSGTVYQKDLGNSTASLAGRMTWFDPDQTWKKVDAPRP